MEYAESIKGQRAEEIFSTINKAEVLPSSLVAFIKSIDKGQFTIVDYAIANSINKALLEELGGKYKDLAIIYLLKIGAELNKGNI